MKSSLGATLVTALLCLPMQARAAVTKKECADAYVDAQRSHKDGLLIVSRDQLLVCSQQACPRAISNECAALLNEVEAAIPTIAVAAKDRWGDATLDVKVYVDGALVAESLDGTGIPVDPGAHTLRFEAAGETPVEQQLLLREGELNRPIDVEFAAPKPAIQGEAERPPTKDKAAERSLDLNPLEPSNLPWVLGGVGVASITGAVLFWISAESSLGDLEDTACSPNCSEHQADSISRQRVIGDVLFIAGVGALGVATYLLLSDRRQAAPTARERAGFDLAPLPGGGMATVRAQF